MALLSFARSAGVFLIAVMLIGLALYLQQTVQIKASVVVNQTGQAMIPRVEPPPSKTGTCSTCPSSAGKVEPGALAEYANQLKEDPWQRVTGRRRGETLSTGAADGQAVVAGFAKAGRLIELATEPGTAFEQRNFSWSTKDGVVSVASSPGVNASTDGIARDLGAWQAQRFPCELRAGESWNSHRIRTANAKHVVLVDESAELDEISIELDDAGRVIRWQHVLGVGDSARRVIAWPDISALND